jgi:diketogulonate reductase-like aldo/keto reductase
MSSSSSSSDLVASLVAAPTITLRNGINHPAIGFGTYKVGFIPASASAVTSGAQKTDGAERTASECVKDALDAGYRFLECAEFYGNEHEVGAAIAASGIPREDLFLCSKVWTTTIEEGPEAVAARLEKTLKDLGTDYIDLYVTFDQ